MTTLTAPQKASITITTPGQSVPVTCATGDKMQVDWASPGGVTGSRLVMNETVDIGPLADNTVVTFTALAGSPTYSAGKVVTAEYNNLTGGVQTIEVVTKAVHDALVAAGTTNPTTNYKIVAA